MYMPPDEIVPVTLEKCTNNPCGVKRRGIAQAARDLNVSYVHLYLVLEGKRESKSLMERIKLIHPELLELRKHTDNP